MTEVLNSNNELPMEDEDPNLNLLTERERTTAYIKSYIAVLCSALGGVDFSSDEKNPPYKLGDEALACLSDFKKWLRLYDDQHHSYEVALACAESGLLINDLLVILCEWEAGTLNKNEPFHKKNQNNNIALACLQVIVPLTWPLELQDGMYKDQVQNYATMKKHQVNYKKHILSYQGGRVLKAIVKLALPVIQTPKSERDSRANGILRLCTYFFRNVLAIEPAAISKHTSKALKTGDITDNLPLGVSYEDVGLGASLIAFEKNLVFQFLLTICGSINTDFDPRELSFICLEMIYDLTRGVSPSVVIKGSNDLSSPSSTKQPGTSSAIVAAGDQPTGDLNLSQLLLKEKGMKDRFIQNGGSRHGRFGTLLSLQTPDQGRLTLSGQKGILDSQNTIAAFDAHKAWHKSQPFRYESDQNVIFASVGLSSDSKISLQKFANDFIDGAFNPLINAVAKEFASDDNPVIKGRPVNKFFFLLVLAWFLEAETLRHGAQVNEVDYGLISAGLSEKVFILVLKYLREGKDGKDWALVHAAMITFKEIINTTNHMGLSENQDDKDISLNIKERLFHKPEVLDAVSHIPRTAFRHSPNFVNNCVDLVHVIMKTLEEFSNQDVTLYIKSNRKSRKKKNVTKEQEVIDELDESDDEAIENAGRRLSKERKFNFEKYQREFVHPDTIDTYISYLNRYKDLSEKDIKKAIQFLHRVFVTQKNRSILYRLDFMLLLHTLLARDGLPRQSHIRKHVSHFLAYFMKKLRASLDSTPSIYTELVFAKALAPKEVRFFIETGELYVEQKTVKRVTKYAVIKDQDEINLERKVSILVASLIDDDMQNLVTWLSEEMEKISIDRIQQDSEEAAQMNNDEPETSQPNGKSIKRKDYKITSQNTAFANSIITNAKVRYLLDLADFELPQQSDEDCVFKGDGDMRKLNETLIYMKMYLMQPVEFGDNKSANDFVKIKQIGRLYDSEFDDGEYDYMNNGFSDEDIAFEARGNRVDDGYNDDLLDKLEDVIDRNDESLPRGVAKAKNRPVKEKRQRKRVNNSDSDSETERPRRQKKARRNRGAALPYHDISDEEGGASQASQFKPTEQISSKYVNDSADESDDDDFFEREKLLREILLKNNGTLGTEQLKEFMSNTLKGKVNQSDIERGEKQIADDYQAAEPKSKEIVENSDDDDIIEPLAGGTQEGTQNTSLSDNEYDFEAVEAFGLNEEDDIDGKESLSPVNIFEQSQKSQASSDTHEDEPDANTSEARIEKTVEDASSNTDKPEIQEEKVGNASKRRTKAIFSDDDEA